MKSLLATVLGVIVLLAAVSAVPAGAQGGMCPLPEAPEGRGK